jgi:hypothetical protein
MPPPGTRSEAPSKGEEFVSDVRTPTFMTLYDQGLVSTEQADDAVEAWHESGDDEHGGGEAEGGCAVDVLASTRYLLST